MTQQTFLPLYLFHRSSSARLRAAYNEFFLCQFSTVYYTLRFILLLHYSLKTASWTLYLNTSENLLGIRILLKVKFYSLNFSVDYFMKVSKVSKGFKRFWKILKSSERFRKDSKGFDRFQKVSKGFERFQKVPKGSEKFRNITKGFERFRKVS